MSVGEGIRGLRRAMEGAGIDPARGLGDELFAFASTLTPIVNVDLFVVNGRRQILLSWRDDALCGRGWHIPGGCVRFRETVDQRLRKCALREFGADVTHDAAPFGVYEFIWNEPRAGLGDQNERAHHIALAYRCELTGGIGAAQGAVPEGQPGHLQWFDDLPADCLAIQAPYRRDWHNIRDKIMRR